MKLGQLRGYHTRDREAFENVGDSGRRERDHSTDRCCQCVGFDKPSPRNNVIFYENSNFVEHCNAFLSKGTYEVRGRAITGEIVKPTRRENDRSGRVCTEHDRRKNYYLSSKF